MYVGIVLRKYLYEQDLDDIFQKDSSIILSLFVMSAFAQVIITWAGSIFVASELPRQGNDELLNGLKEGILILEEDSSIIKFQNQAALRLITEYSDNLSISVVDEKFAFEKELEMFAPVNMAEIFDDNTTYDYDEVKKKVKLINNYISMNEIIADTNSEGLKQVFKLKTDSSRKKKPQTAKIPNQFLRIKVKRQTYEGIASIVIFISDVTKKINGKLQTIKVNEK